MACNCKKRGTKLFPHFYVNRSGGREFASVLFTDPVVLTSTVNSRNVLVVADDPYDVYQEDLAYWLRRGIVTSVVIIENEEEFYSNYPDLAP